MILLNPKGKVNLHTHTSYCDGKDTVDSMVRKAIELGMEAIGFSGHEHSDYDESYCMSLSDTERYREEVLAAKEKYKDIIKVYLGIERDFYGEGSDYNYDYVIGSVHSVKVGDAYIYADYSEKQFVSDVKEYFGGDYMAFVKTYYRVIEDVALKTNATIVGHFDLICKFNEGNKYFDEDSTEYKEAALDALSKVARSHPIFEINTGAMAKGYRTRPYPAKFLIDEIIRLGCPLILSSDCHNMDKLDYGFSQIIKQFKI